MGLVPTRDPPPGTAVVRMTRTRWIRSTRSALLSLAVVAALALTAGAASPASAKGGASGSKNCTGHGKIVVRTTYQPYYGINVAVKRAGPPSGPTWGASAAPQPSSFPQQTVETAWFSPYAEGHWSAYSPGSRMVASAACSQPGRSAEQTLALRATETRNLGNKSCSGGNKVRIIADSFVKTEVSWKSTPSSPRNTVTFPAGFPTFNDVRTGEAAVYGIVVTFFGGEPQSNHTGVTCF